MTCLHCNHESDELDGDAACPTCQAETERAYKDWANRSDISAKRAWEVANPPRTIHGPRLPNPGLVVAGYYRGTPEWVQRHANMRRISDGPSAGKWQWSGYWTEAYDPQMVREERGLPHGIYESEDLCLEQARAYCARVSRINDPEAASRATDAA